MNPGEYLNAVICQALPCSDFGQRALEHAVIVGNYKLTGNIDTDITALMSLYDEHCHTYRSHLAEQMADAIARFQVPAEVGV